MVEIVGVKQNKIIGKVNKIKPFSLFIKWKYNKYNPINKNIKSLLISLNCLQIVVSKTKAFVNRDTKIPAKTQ